MSFYSIENPPFVVFENKFGRGLDCEEDLQDSSLGWAEVKNFWTAIQENYESDAHFVCYTIPGEEKTPRINKRGQFVIKSLGGNIVSSFVAIDWDKKPGPNGEKQEWDLDGAQEFLNYVAEVEEKNPLIANYSAFYLTNHGARWIYVLSKQIPVIEGQQITRGMINLFRESGLDVDPIFDWPRMFRMPNVIRNGKNTWDKDWHYLDVVPGQFVDPEKLPRLAVLPNTKQELGSQRPDFDFAEDLLWENKALGKRSDFWKEAKKRLKGRECFPCIFEGSELAPPGKRNQAIFTFSGQVVSLLYDESGTSPEGCYALLQESVSRCPVGKDHPLDTLWRAIAHAWREEDFKLEQKEEKQQLFEIESQDTWAGIYTGVKRWYSGAYSENLELFKEFMENKLILGFPNGTYSIMRPDGLYDKMQVPSSQLISRIRSLKMDCVIPTYVDEENKITKSVTKIIDYNCIPVDKMTSGYSGFVGTTVTNLGSDSQIANYPAFCEDPYLVSEFSEEVELWLRSICYSEEDYLKLTDWIGHSQDYLNPIAALVVIGPPSIGKKMLVMGLAETLADPITADFTDITSGYPDMLTRTPFVIANEGFPKEKYNSGKRLADVIRELVVGDPISINRKYKTSVQMQVNYRVIVTANNDQCIQNLYEGQDLTPEDRKAIAKRLVVIRASPKAAIYLQNLGGQSYTAKKGSSWIAPTSGGASDKKVAKHFKYLYENREEPALGQRLLVEGNDQDRLFEEMTLNSGLAPTVLESLFEMFNQITPPKGLRYIEEDTDNIPKGVYVSTKGVVDFARMMNLVSRSPSLKSVGQTLASIASGKYRFDGAMLYRLDMEFIVKYGTGFGIHPTEGVLKFLDGEKPFFQKKKVGSKKNKDVSNAPNL